MKKLLIAGLVMMSSVAMAGGDVAAGKAKSATCMACHGNDGISLMAMYPNLKGQKEQYLFKQMKAFKDGSRVDPIMKGMVAALSEADMENLSAYYASLK